MNPFWLPPLITARALLCGVAALGALTIIGLGGVVQTVMALVKVLDRAIARVAVNKG